jgi:hypothetical protein
MYLQYLQYTCSVLEVELLAAVPVAECRCAPASKDVDSEVE